MNPGDNLRAWVRTVWPAFVGYLTGLLMTYLGEKVGIEVDSTQVAGAVTVVLVGIIYGLGRWLEGRTSPAARRLGHLLVSTGVDLGTPTYAKTDDRQPDAGTPPGVRR